MEPMLNPLARLPVEKATGRKLFIKTVLARAYPRIVGQQREKSWVFFEIFLPMLAVSSYVFVYQGHRTRRKRTWDSWWWAGP